MESTDLPNDTEDELTLRRALKWYFSPYLSTIITAPMFLVLLLAFVSAVLFSLWYYILIIIAHPIVLFLLPGIPLWGVHAMILYYAFMRMPSVWSNKRRSAATRILLISFIFIAALFFWNVWEAVQFMITGWLTGRSLF